MMTGEMNWPVGEGPGVLPPAPSMSVAGEAPRAQRRSGDRRNIGLRAKPVMGNGGDAAAG